MKGSVVTIGVFDGVHVGHRQVLELVVSRAGELGVGAVVVTFEPHPDEVLGKVRGGRFLLTTPDEKKALLANTGVDVEVLVEFTPGVARMDAAAFVKKYLCEALALKVLVMGHDFRMGRERNGDRDVLESLGASLGFSVEEVEPVVIGGSPVSSTRVRNAILGGDMELAMTLLGRRYSLEGLVVPGKGTGRKLGFPTANLSVHEKKLVPPDGVYAALADVQGQTLKAAVNIGVRPTVGGEERLVEGHLIGFEGDILGRQMSLSFVCRIREERKFPSRDALSRAIVDDVQKIAHLVDI
ncbi:MAG: riboflavin biosynthesis protein RibF [Candidatus Eisenbacteria bacterium]